ncbi:MAG: endonuclease/exonuclease/phosphatase family protein [Chitinophagaceae bacterium]|nr:endonuclease/exonuclease/phosphatase family protein [Chitinophagaceae bacterium]
MKIAIVLAVIFLLPILSLAQERELNIMTFNIRYNTARDSANAWPNRTAFAASQIAFHQAHIIGVQEALHGQMTDLLELLPNHRYIGVGRDDGKEKGEYSAVIYDSLRLKPLRSATFWLSETPEIIGSKSWDAAITRIVTWVLFRDLKTKKEFYLFNTHFDHIGKIARRSSAELLLKKIAEIAKGKQVIITGDFNAKPADEPIQVILNPADANRLADSKDLSVQPHYGPTGTFNGFQSKETDDKPIDYIFLKGKFKVLQHATLSQTWQGRFSSDHFPVFARLILQ